MAESGRLRAYLAAAWDWRDATVVGLTLAALLAAAVVVAGTGTRSDEASDAPQPPPESSPPDPAPPQSPVRELPLTASEDGGELRIVESGFSPITDRPDNLVSWGLIVENTSSESAASVVLDVDVIDANGDSLVKGDGWQRSRRIDLIMPGERAGIGHATYVTGPGVADVTFELADPRWWPLDNDRRPVARLGVSEIEIVSGGLRWAIGDPLTLRFRVESGYDHMVTGPGVQMVFRDEEGEVVAGIYSGPTVHAAIPPGWSIQRSEVRYDLPEQVDLDRTEVYVYEYCCL